MKVIDNYQNGESKQPETYESYEAALTDKTNYSVKNDAGKFSRVFHKAFIRTDSTISVKINSTSSDSITVASTDSSFKIEDMTIKDLYISNTGTANVKILLN